MVTITLKQLKKAYNNATKNKQKYFTLNKNEFYTKYAKYLIEYLKNLGLDDDSPIPFNKGGNK